MKVQTLIIIVVIITSCTQQKKNLLEFDPKVVDNNNVKLSEIADDISYIPLDNSIKIGLIYNYRISKNSIYLSAKDIGVLEFNKDGKFVRNIGNIGRGPGEYTYYFDFTVDDNSGAIYVLDQGNLKVYSKSGNYLRSITLNKYGDNLASFEIIDSKVIIYFMLQYGEPKYDWIVIDTLGNMINGKKRSIPEFKTNWLIQGGTYKYDNRVTYWNPFTDTAFSILPDLTYKASFIITPGEHRFPKVKFESFEEFQKYLRIENIFETNQYIFLRYHYQKPTIALIDKKTGKTYQSFLTVANGNGIRPDYSGGIANDLDGGRMFQPGGASARQESYYIENGKEYIIGLIDSYKITSLLNDTDFIKSIPEYPKKKIELEELANSLNETDNPLMMIVRLK